MSRLILLTSTPRVPAGLLSAPAWDALRGSSRVLTADPGHPQRPYVEAAGVPVEVLAAAGVRELAATLVRAAAAADVVFLGGQDGDPGLGDAMAGVLADLAHRGSAVPVVEVVPGSWDAPGARLLDLVAVMDRLRSPGGCPWDAEQTHESLRPYLLEETYETLETIDGGDRVGLREELGDLLLQVVFHARIAEEDADTPWSIDDVAAGIVEKLVRRHPHVFAEGYAPTAAHVEVNWRQLKAVEKGRVSTLEGVALAQPALALADKLMSRVEDAGLDVPVPVLERDVGGTGENLGNDMSDDIGDHIGELLLSVVAHARRRGVDAEAALRGAARRYAERVRAAERVAEETAG